MRRFLKLMLIIEAVAILASCVCGAMTVSALFVKLEFVSTYRAICTSALATSVLLLCTMIAQEICLKENTVRQRIVRIVGGIILFLMTFSVSSWMFNPIEEAQIKRAAYLNIWVWIGVIPIVLAAVMFFKPQATARQGHARE